MLFPTLKKKIGVKKKIRGRCGFLFFLEIQFFLISRCMLFSTLKKNIQKCPFTLGIQNNYFSFNVFFVSFFVCWKYCKVPLHLQLLVKWEVVSPNTCSRYRECYHEIGNIEKFPFTYWLNGRWFLQIVDIHVGNFDMKLIGRWFPQIVDRDSGNLYPIYIWQKLWCNFLNLFAGDLGRPSCLVIFYFSF